MRFLFVAWKMKLKSLMNNKTYMFVMICLPIMVMLFACYARVYLDASTLQVGVYCNADSKLGQAIEEYLIKDKDIHFIKYTSEEALKRDVERVKVECGFILKSSIDEAASSMELKECITLLKSPATSAEGSIRETVTAAFYRCISKDVVFNILKHKDYLKAEAPERMRAILGTQIDSYYKNGELMKVNFIWGKEERVSTQGQKLGSTIKTIKGIIGIFLLISSLFVGIKIGEERRNNLYIRICTLPRRVIHPEVAVCLAHITMECLVGILSIAGVKIIVQGLIEINFIKEVLSLILYSVTLGSVMLLLGQIIKNTQVWLSFIPILIIICIVFCPIFFQISDYNKVLGSIQYLLLPYYYVIGKNGYVSLLGISVFSTIFYKLFKDFRRLCRHTI